MQVTTMALDNVKNYDGEENVHAAELELSSGSGSHRDGGEQEEHGAVISAATMTDLEQGGGESDPSAQEENGTTNGEEEEEAGAQDISDGTMMKEDRQEEEVKDEEAIDLELAADGGTDLHMINMSAEEESCISSVTRELPDIAAPALYPSVSNVLRNVDNENGIGYGEELQDLEQGVLSSKMTGIKTEEGTGPKGTPVAETATDPKGRHPEEKVAQAVTGVAATPDAKDDQKLPAKESKEGGAAERSSVPTYEAQKSVQPTTSGQPSTATDVPTMAPSAGTEREDVTVAQMTIAHMEIDRMVEEIQAFPSADTHRPAPHELQVPGAYAVGGIPPGWSYGSTAAQERSRPQRNQSTEETLPPEIVQPDGDGTLGLVVARQVQDENGAGLQEASRVEDGDSARKDQNAPAYKWTAAFLLLVVVVLGGCILLPVLVLSRDSSHTESTPVPAVPTSPPTSLDSMDLFLGSLPKETLEALEDEGSHQFGSNGMGAK